MNSAIKTLLITASLNPGNQSNSRLLGEYACKKLAERLPGSQVNRRDLAKIIPSPITSQNLSAIVSSDSSTPEAAALLQEANTYADEVEAADQIIIATPMYNLFVPAGLKAYIDLLVRREKNFVDTPDGPKGLLTDRPLLVIVTSGGPFLEGDKTFFATYFKRAFGFIGIHNVSLVTAENLNMAEELAEKGLKEGKTGIDIYLENRNDSTK